ncbi:MAG: riboflavin synthase [Chitinophagia bacterium]|nr:riboflavin synthase [Chitinophagia bacterium]
MFTGIIEKIGIVTDIISSDNNISFWIKSPISEELSIDQSVAHNGVCLTVEEIIEGKHRVTAIQETLNKTNLKQWKKNSFINLERCLPMNGRLDGHLVQGHIDSVAICLEIVEKQGSWEYTFEFEPKFASLIIEKGSITVNGISLTLFEVTKHSFRVAIIPYTYEHTNMQHLIRCDEVNIEFDMIGKYINRMMELRK